ncbi:MAG: hypothetical protein ACT4NY_20765 [Pseudonocardiales bacterium]
MPEPILISIAAAIAGKTASGLYDLVKRRYSGNRQATAELEAAVEDPADPQLIEVIAERLAIAEESDPDFRAALRSEWDKITVTQHAEGGVANQVYGNVSGKVVQARDIHGNISL